MSQEMKPCPFCGSTKQMMLGPTCDRNTPYDPNDRAFPIVRCFGCITDVSGQNFDASGKSAIENWNRRAETWRPIAEADKGIAHILDAAGLHIGNSLPIWARDEDGRVFECLWADDGKRAYWWDIEGESPVDPVEFMPHPLAPIPPTRSQEPTL